MRVLLANKFFRSGAGAETAFFATRNLLQRRGHDVIDFAMADAANDRSPYASFFAPSRDYGGGGVRRAVDAAASVYSPGARRQLGRLLDEHRPDVAHLHNVYHQLTLSIVDELHARGIPTVMTLHDWKVACPAYTLYTHGEPCRRCPTSGVHSAVRLRCVKGSAAASAIAAVEARVVRTRRSYSKIDRYIAPSQFAVVVAGLAGIEAERVSYVPNFLPDEELNRAIAPVDGGVRFLYVGRLDRTKGVAVLLEAFEAVRSSATLEIAGSGDLEAEARAAAARDPRITYLGRLDRPEVMAAYDRSACVLIPSVWEDNGPLVVLEAQAAGRPLIVSDRGGLPEFVKHDHTGLVVAADDVAALSAAMERVAAEPARARIWGERAAQVVREQHTENEHYERLLDVYAEAAKGATL